MKEVYLDYASATPLDPRVKDAMEPYWDLAFGNPSALHDKGRQAKEAIDKARERVTRILHCRSGEIIFTAGATEADNLAILGVARATTPGHLITTQIEHDAVLRTFAALEEEGWPVTYLDVGSDGLVEPKKVAAALRPDTVLVSISYANNEIGTIQPIAAIGKVIKEYRETKKREAGSSTLDANEKAPLFHSDASQAAGFLDLNVDRLGVDLLTLNAAKIYGPKGVGALFVRNGVKLEPIFHGGGQEKNLRSGTENVPGIVGLSKALEIAEAERVKESARLAALRDYFVSRLLKEIPGTVLNGHPTERLPSNINISVAGIDGETAVVYLDAEGIFAATGSACTATSLEPSHVVIALGRPRELAESSLRFTLGRATTKEDIDYVIEVFTDVLGKLRKSLPVAVVAS